MQAEMDGTGREHHYILMTGPDPLVSLYPPIVRAVCQQRRVTAGYSWQTISQALCSHRVTRTAANGLEVEVIGGSMLNTELERLFRSPKRPLALGQEIDLGYMKVTVLELGSAGPSRVGLEFEKPLEDPSLWFLVWKDSGLRKFVPPRIGESVVISFERGLM